MKKIIIMLVIFLTSVLAADAQNNGLNITPFFSSVYAGRPEVTMLSLSGTQLEARNLSKYNSISVTNDAALADKITQAVIKDGANARSKNVSYKKGQLYFGFYFLGGKGWHRKYILYLNRRPVGKEKVTLIYIEGNVSESVVKKMIR